jgi:hypothetical protein
MLRKLTHGLMALLLAATAMLGAIDGVAAMHGNEHECPMQGMHDCCKRARQQSNAPGVAAARLCCVVNCQQSAPTGTSFNFQSSPAAANTPRPPVAQVPDARAFAQAREYSPPFHPSHSPPAYILHTAFLI